MKDIYEMFKAGMSTDDIYNAFMKEYDAAKLKHNEDIKQAKMAEAKAKAERKAREEKEKAEAASKRRNQALSRYRETLADAFYDYFDFLMPNPIDYDETIPAINQALTDFEDSISGATAIAQPFIDALMKYADTTTSSKKPVSKTIDQEKEDEWDIDLESSLTIDDKEVNSSKVRLSSSDNLKNEDMRKTFTKYMEGLDQDKEIIREYLNKLFDQ